MRKPTLHEAVTCRLDRRAFLAAGAALFASAGIRPGFAHVVAPAPISGFELPQPMALKPFRLANHRGEPFDPASLRDRWTLLLFGFTHCPDVCPTTLAQIAQVRTTLSLQHRDVPTQSVFVTIDPARDTPQRLAVYVRSFGDDLVGVTGAAPELDAFAKQFRIRYTQTKLADPAGYLFDHTASVSLLGPVTRLHAIFTLPLRPATVAADIARMHGQHRTSSCAGGHPAGASACTKGNA
jgi:protein SCO1/2